MVVPIPETVLDFAKLRCAPLVPETRTSGFADPEGSRGHGDYVGYVATIVTTDYLAAHGCWVREQYCAGPGDEFDIQIFGGKRWHSINVKSSTYAPFDNHLHLYVKAEELEKPAEYYVQVFVHANGPCGQGPHAHLAGYARKADVLATPLREIPGTGGHLGVCLPLGALDPIEHIPARVAKKRRLGK